MSTNKYILFFPGGNYYSKIKQIDQYLSEFLSKTYHVISFEYPQFSKIFKILFRKIRLLEKINSNFFVYHSFGLLPLGRNFTFINSLNHKFNFFIFNKLFKPRLQNYLTLTFTPEIAYLQLNSHKTVYHVLDRYTSLDWWNNRFAKRQFDTLEKRLLKFTSVVITVSPHLAKFYKKFVKNVFVFHTPANLNQYLSYQPAKDAVPQDLNKIPKPIIGFIGSATIKNKIDWQLIKYLAEKYPHYNFVFIGYFLKNKSQFPKSSNVINLGYKKWQKLPQYISNFNICIIPYSTNSYGLGAYPVKIMEYLALGKPVVTSDLPSLSFLKKEKDLIYTAKNNNEFGLKIESALKESDQTLIAKRIAIAKQFAWENKISQYLKIIK